MSDYCEKCDKECTNHGTMELLVKQHDERIGTVEGTIDEMGRDIAKMEGRLNSFIWVLGLVFSTLVALSFYGSLQVGKFKDVWTTQTINTNKTLESIKADMDYVKRDISRLEK